MLEKRIRKVTRKIASHNVKEAASLKDMGFDSLDELELIMLLEEEFGIEIDDDEWANVKTFGDITAIVTRATGAVCGDY